MRDIYESDGVVYVSGDGFNVLVTTMYHRDIDLQMDHVNSIRVCGDFIFVKKYDCQHLSIASHRNFVSIEKYRSTSFTVMRFFDRFSNLRSFSHNSTVIRSSSHINEIQVYDIYKSVDRYRDNIIGQKTIPQGSSI